MDDRNQSGRPSGHRSRGGKHGHEHSRNPTRPPTGLSASGQFDQSVSDRGNRPAGLCGRLLRVGLETRKVKRHGCRRIDRKGRLSVRKGPARIHRVVGRAGMETGELTGRKDTNPPSRKEGQSKNSKSKERKLKWLT